MSNSLNNITLYELQEVAEKLKVGIRTLREYIKTGRLKAKRIGRSYKVTESELLRFIDQE